MNEKRTLFWLKGHYAFVFSILGVVLPYLALFLEQELKFTDARIGWIQSQLTAGIIVTPLFMTYLADRWLSNRSLLGVLYAMSGAGLFLTTKVETFSGTLLVFALFAFGFAATIPVLNGLCLGVLDKTAATQQTRYHHVRLWGTFGFMIPSVVLFFVFSRPQVSTVWALYLGAILAILGVITISGLPGRETGAANPQSLPTKEVLRIFSKPPVRGLIIATFLLSVASGAFFTFYPLYLGRLGIPTRWIGLIVNIGVVVEVGFMLAAGWLQRRLGFRRIMLMALGAGVIRMSLVAMFPSAVVAVATQVLHGPMILAVILVPILFLNEQAGDHNRNSIQGLYTMLCRGLSRVIGPPLAGYISILGGSEQGGIAGLRLVFALGAGITMIAFMVTFFAFYDVKHHG